jgi:uncharacterized protein (TIGR04255 family)
MACKYENPPVIYAVAKVIFKQGIGSHSEEKYKQLLESLKPLGFESYQRSNVKGIQLKQADNSFSIKEAESARLAYFSPNRQISVLLDENVIELRVSHYTDHSFFLDTFKKVLDACMDNELTIGSQLREVELNYVDLFVPNECSLEEMFKVITLPNKQFHYEADDVVHVGSINFTRVVAPGNIKVVVNLEQLPKRKEQGAKFLPNSLMEPDDLFTMPVNLERLFLDTYEGDYAIVHTICGGLMEEGFKYNTQVIRDKFENLYSESIKTFDHMIDTDVCNRIWKPIIDKKEL